MVLPQPLVAGRLVRRYKRFLADIELEDGSLVTAHTPNTGSMQQCAVPGQQVLLSKSDNPKRKLAWSWELVRVNDHWVDINTHRANRVVEEALRNNVLRVFRIIRFARNSLLPKAASILCWKGRTRRFSLKSRMSLSAASLVLPVFRMLSPRGARNTCET